MVGMWQEMNFIYNTQCKNSLGQNVKYTTLPNTSKGNTFHGFFSPWSLLLFQD